MRTSLFFLRRPSTADLDALARRGEGTAYGYDEIGATRGGRDAVHASVGAAYDVDCNLVVLGHGRELFDRAAAAVLAWRSFDLPWLTLHGARAPVEAGQIATTIVHAIALWAVNSCRVVYVLREDDRAGFAYGTLVGHVERGEERFMVEHDRATNRVTFEILAFSRPAHPLVRIGKPYARALQRRFARDSLAAMRRATSA